MLVDYADTLSRMEQALGRHFATSPSILNEPGVSVAVKIDPFYYLALRPTFGELLGKWSGITPARAEETLMRTGNLVLGPGRSRYAKVLAAVMEGTGVVVRLAADFIQAEWIDRAIMLYGGQSGPLPVSGLRLAAEQREALATFFAGMTPLAALAFADAATT